MRAAIIRALVDGDRPESATDERLEQFMESGLIAKEFILNPGVVELLASMQGDVMRFAKPIEAIQTAVGVGQPQVLRRSMMMVPPTGPDALNQPWTGLDELSGLAPGDEISSAWLDLQSAWIAEDASGVNTRLSPSPIP